MKKTIGDVASYLKQLLPMNIPKTYDLNIMFTSILNEENIRPGVLAFRDFMVGLYDCLMEDESLSDIAIKGNKKFSDDTTLTVEFPILNNIKSILINIGQHGVLSEQNNSIMVMGWDTLSLKRSLNKHSTTKISVPQMMKSLRFLAGCGISFTGIDLSVKKPDLSKIEMIEITYPNNPMMLIGWKALGVAQGELSTRKNDDILLRCDYRMLRNENDEMTSILEAFINPLTAQLRKLVLDLHQYYLDSRMECHVEQGFLCTHFIYSYKRKAIWRLSVSYHNGYRMVLKTKNTEKYPEVVDRFPDYLREKITKGYGCDRKKGTGHGNCQKGCEGFSFPLDESLLNISEELKLWQESELSSM